MTPDEESRARAVLTNHDKRRAKENYEMALEFLYRAQMAARDADHLRRDPLCDPAVLSGQDADATSYHLSAVVHAVLSVTDQLRGSRKASWP